MAKTHLPVDARCTSCGGILVQDYQVALSDAGSVTTPRGTVRCTNPACAKANLVGWSAIGSPRPQRG